MSMAKYSLAKVVVLGCAVFHVNVAFAQASATQLNGFKFGEGRLHVLGSLDTRYDSAGGFFAGATADLRLSPEIISQFGLGLKYEWATDSTAVNVDGKANYLLYTGILTPGSRAVSRLQGDVQVGAHFNRNGAFGLKVTDTLTRTDQVQNLLLATAALMLRNEAKIETPWRPGGGALEVTPSAAWAVEMFDAISSLTVAGCTPGDPQCSPDALASMNNTNVNLSLDNRWRFLPRTSLVLSGSYDWRSYPDTANRLLRIQGGLSGLLTSRILVLALAGYARDFAMTNINDFLGQLEISYLFNELTSIKAGFSRNVFPMAVYGAVGNNRLYLEGKTVLGGRLTLRAQGSYQQFTFIKTNGSTLPDRADSALGLEIGPEYQFSQWLSVAAGYLYSYRQSTNVLEGFNFPRNEGYLRLNMSY